MASRRDQLQSYQFRSQRVVTAFVMREADPAQTPLRRGIGALLIGAMIAVLAAAGFGVYGIITKTGSDTWKADGAVVVEKETGATFVYSEGRLHPTLNYASALLAAGQSPPDVFQVSANSLAATPRAATIGIGGAPNSLPDKAHLTTVPWTVCSVATTTASQTATTAVQVTVGGTATGARSVAASDGILASDSSSGALSLIWHAHRYRVAPSLRLALFANIAAVPVGPALLDTLPVGRDISAIVVPEIGQPSVEVHGRRNGQVLVAQTGSGPLYYLVFNDGLAAITTLQKDSLAASTPMPIAVAAAAAIRTSSHLRPVTGAQAPPLAPPQHLISPAAPGQVCATFPTDGGDPQLTTGGVAPPAGIPTAGQASLGTVLADAVSVPAGHGALVVAQPSAGFSIGGWFLVTDTGVRYAVTTVDDVHYLGYDPQGAQPVPASLLARIPAGPPLDHAAASAAIAPPA